MRFFLCLAQCVPFWSSTHFKPFLDSFMRDMFHYTASSMLLPLHHTIKKSTQIVNLYSMSNLCKQTVKMYVCFYYNDIFKTTNQS